MLVGKVSKKLGALSTRFKARQELAQLHRQGGELGAPLELALRKTLLHRLTAEERSLVRQIEALRQRAYASTDDVEIIDYGSGKRTEQLDVGETMHEGQVLVRKVGEFGQSVSKRYSWALMLFNLLRAYQPRTCVELGTALGISASYQAAALQLNGKGRLVTMEGSPALAELARGHFRSLGLDRVEVVVGPFYRTLDSTLEQHKPLDYVFIDGHHDEQATLAYFEQLLPHLADGAVLVFDDINWSEGMTRAWRTIVGDPRVKLSVDLAIVGVCVLGKAGHTKQHIDMPYVVQILRGIQFG